LPSLKNPEKKNYGKAKLEGKTPYSKVCRIWLTCPIRNILWEQTVFDIGYRKVEVTQLFYHYVGIKTPGKEC
jgi:hypothetical protein